MDVQELLGRREELRDVDEHDEEEAVEHRVGHERQLQLEQPVERRLEARLRGEVVGVNSQIYSQSGGYMGVSFAIPIDIAAKVARQLRDTGVVTRGWLGVVVQEVDRDIAKQFSMAKAEGALIARVLPDSPAARAGLREGDVILRYNGEPLASSQSLPHMVGITDPGEVATLDVIRAGKELQLRIEVGTLRSEQTPSPAVSSPRPRGS